MVVGRTDRETGSISRADSLCHVTLNFNESQFCLHNGELHTLLRASQVVLMVKNPPANIADMRFGFDPWVWKTPWKGTWQPTPVFWSGESPGQRSLAGYSP